MTLANSRFAFNIAALMNRRGKFSIGRAFTEKKRHFFYVRGEEKRETI